MDGIFGSDKRKSEMNRSKKNKAAAKRKDEEDSKKGPQKGGDSKHSAKNDSSASREGGKPPKKKARFADAKSDDAEEQEAEDEVEQKDDDDSEEPLIPDVDPEVFWNPLFECYRRWTASASEDMPRIFDPSLDDTVRAKLLNQLPSRASRKYAWAIPDQRAIQILHNYAPIVEMGAGKGYWGYALQKYTDLLNSVKSTNLSSRTAYIGFDSMPHLTAEELQAMKQAELEANGGVEKPFKKRRRGKKGKKPRVDEYPAWCKIKKGGPSQLNAFPEHTLFLCYPDDFEQSEDSMAAECLQHFAGDTVIVVGEAMGQTLGENPWGKSADGSFQLQLAATFHKTLQVPLPSWPGSMDTLTVWKRTPRCTIDEDMEFKFIPSQEQLELTLASPSTQNLLSMKPIEHLLKAAKK